MIPAISVARPSTRSRLRTAVAFSAALTVALLGVFTAGAPAFAVTDHGYVTLAKEAVLSTGTTNPAVSNVASTPGEVFNYTISYTCVVDSGFECRDLVITDVLPAELELVGATPSTWVVTGQTVQISVGTIAASGGSLSIPVRFKSNAAYASGDLLPTTNTATAAYSIGNSAGSTPDTATSNSVDVVGLVTTLGGATSSKTLTPATVPEFSGQVVSGTLSGTNSGSGTADSVTITDADAEFFDAFQISSVDAPVVAAGAGAAVVEYNDGTSWLPLTVPFTGSLDAYGLRVVIAGVPAGGQTSLAFTATLRNALLSGGEVVSAGAARSIVNDATTSVVYSDPALNRDAPTSATVTVQNATAGVPRMTKTVEPQVISVGQDVPVTYSLSTGWDSAATGGLASITISDPAPGSTTNAFDLLDPTSVVIKSWPSTDAQSVTIATNCGSTTVARTGNNQTVTLPCAGSAIDSISFTFTRDGGAFYAGNATAAVDLVTELEAGVSNTAQFITNTARVDTATGYGNLTSTDDSDVSTFQIQNPQFTVTTTKLFAQPESVSPTNVVMLRGQVVATPSTATVDKLVLQDPAVIDETGTSGGTDFFDQYSITELRTVNCPAGYDVTIEVWDAAASAWVTLVVPSASSFTNFCDVPRSQAAAAGETVYFPLALGDLLPAGVTASSIEGIRYTYTNPADLPATAGGVSTVNIQPQFGIEFRAANTETAAPQTLPVYVDGANPQASITSAPNCAVGTVYVGNQVAGTPGEADCVSVKQVTGPPRTGGGAGVAKHVYGLAGTGSEATAGEFLDGQFFADFELSQTGLMTEVEYLRLSDPIDPANLSTGFFGGGYQAKLSSQIFGSITNIRTITSTSGIPVHEKATLELYNPTTDAWTAVQTIRGTGTNNISYSLGADYANYSAWRITLAQDENNASVDSGDLAPGFVDPNHFIPGATFKVTVRYELRDTFRQAIAGNAAGAPVLNNLCYGVSASPLVEDPTTGLTDPAACDLPFVSRPNEAGYVFNDAEGSAKGIDAVEGGDPVTTYSTTSMQYPEDHDLQITSNTVNLTPVKTFWKGAVQDGNDTTPAFVPIPAAGQSPAAQQERTVRIEAANITSVAVDAVIVDDANSATPGDNFWTAFELLNATVSLRNSAGNAVADLGYVAANVRFSTTGGTPQTGLTLAELNALTTAEKRAITEVTIEAKSIPALTTLRVEFGTRLRASVTTSINRVNDMSVTYTADGVNTQTENAQAAISASDARNGVVADKTIALASGEVNAIDSEPVLNVTTGAQNSGDLPLNSLIVEDDDIITPSGYGTPSIPATLPTNDANFWDDVTFDTITGVTFPTSATQVVIETFTGSAWTIVGTYPAGTAASAINADITGAAGIKGLRATFTAGPGKIGLSERGALTFQVHVNSDVAPGVALTNYAEAAFTAPGVTTVYQNPSGASFTPSLGTLKVDVQKTTPAAAALSGQVIPFTLKFTNTGQQTIGLHPGTSPLTIVDTLPSTLVFDTSVASISATFPASGGTSTFADDVLPAVAYDGAANTLTWAFAPGEGLGAGESIEIRLSLRIASATPAQTQVTNTAGILMPSAAACTPPDSFVNGRCSSAASLTVTTGGNVTGSKTITGNSNLSTDPTVTCAATGAVSYPCVALTPAGSEYTWTLSMENSGNEALYNSVLIDRLPAVGDRTLVGGFPRGSEWNSAVRGPVTATADGLTAPLVVQYLPSSVAASAATVCYSELTTGAAPCAEWLTLAPGADLPADAIAIRVAAPYSVGGEPMFTPTSKVTVSWTETVPASLTGAVDTASPNGAAVADGDLQQWNNFSFRVRYGVLGAAFTIDAIKAGAQFDSAQLRIGKIVEEDTLLEPADFGSFTVNVICDFNNGGSADDYSGSVTVADGEFETIYGLPSGATCVLEEQDAPATATWSVDENPATPNADVTVSYDSATAAPVEAIVTNSYASQVLQVTKLVTGDAPTTLGEFAFQLQCTLAGVDIPLEATDAAFSLSADGVHEVTGLPLGAECELTEPDNGGAVSTTIDGVLLVDGETSATFSVDASPRQVTVVNDFAATSLRVVKAVENTLAAEFPVGPFEIQVTCEVPGENEPRLFPITITDPQGGEQTIEHLPAGTECAVVETDAAGAHETAYADTYGASDSELSDGEVVLGINTQQTVTVTNRYLAGALTITKTLVGAAPVNGAEFDIQVICSYNGAVLPLLAEDAEFSLAGGASHTIDGLPLGAECVVSEPDNGGAASTTINGETVTDADAGVAVTLDSTEQNVPVVNNFGDTALVIVKNVDNALAEGFTVGPFEITATCTVDGEDAPRVQTFTFDAAGGQQVWEGLPVGTECTTVETGSSGAHSVEIVDTDGEVADGVVTIAADSTEQVTVTNRYEATSVSVVKSTEGATDETQWDFTVVCTWLGQTVEFDGQASAGVPVLVDGVPVGAECVISEGETTADETIWTVGDETLTPASDGSVAVTLDGASSPVVISVLNRYLADLAITKTVKGGTAPQDATFTVTLTPVAGGDPITVDIKGGETVELDGLLAGAEYLVLETVNGGAKTITYTGVTDGLLTLAQGDNSVGVLNTFADVPPAHNPGGLAFTGQLPTGIVLATLTGLLLLSGGAVFILLAVRRRRMEENA